MEVNIWVRNHESNEKRLVIVTSDAKVSALYAGAAEAFLLEERFFELLNDGEVLLPEMPMMDTGLTAEAVVGLCPSRASIAALELRKMQLPVTQEGFMNAAAAGEICCVRLYAIALPLFDGLQSSKTPLHAAAEAGHRNVIEMLLLNGARPDVEDAEGTTPLLLAARHGHLEIVELLLPLCRVDAPNTAGETPLHAAAHCGSLDVLSLLLRKDANLSAHSSDLWTALHYAASGGSEECCSLLLSKDVHVCPQDSEGYTPLHFAAEDGSPHIVRVLLAFGAPVDVFSNHHTTPLMLASQFGGVDTVELLLEAGARHDLVDNDGDTPLHCVAAGVNVDGVSIAELLLQRGANRRARNRAGQTPRDIALAEREYHIARLLENSTAGRQCCGCNLA